MSRYKKITACNCGTTYHVRTGSGGTVFHCQCPACERHAVGITLLLARAFEGTALGTFLTRMVDARFAIAEGPR